MLEVWLALAVILAMGVFLLLGGPLWAATTVRVFRAGPEVPGWLATTTIWICRAVGAAMILTGLMLAGSALSTLI